MSIGTVSYRPASAEDQAFINHINMVATYGARMPESDYPSTSKILAERPHIAEFSHGFGRAGDMGLIALDYCMKPIGAIWGREYARSADDLVMADHTFEITMGVRDRARRKGVGRQLLDRFADMARTEGHSELSLGVHVESRARKLYEAAGYMPILDSEGNEQILPGKFVAMALELDAPVLRVQTLQEDELSTRALIKLRGRNRTTINHGSTTTYHVLRGEGTMTVDDVVHELKPGVTIEVPPHVPYFDEGNVDMVAVSEPPFNMDDVEAVMEDKLNSFTSKL